MKHPFVPRCLHIAIAVAVAFGSTGCAEPEPEPIPRLDLILEGGTIVDGTGRASFVADVGILDQRIRVIGDLAGQEADERIDVVGRTLTPGFIDMHSHAQLDEDVGRDARPFLSQGITTVVLGGAGSGTHEVEARLEAWADAGIGVNALTYVGHSHVRREVLGFDDRAPTPGELDTMRDMVRQAINEGAFGLSTDLTDAPGYFASTSEIVQLAQAVADEMPGAIYDTRDRDDGATPGGVGIEASIREAVQVGAESGLRVSFSHFHPQGPENYGRVEEAAQLIEDATLRGLDVVAAHPFYPSTRSTLRADALPTWATGGGPDATVRRFSRRDTAQIIYSHIDQALALRGGPDKILFADADSRLDGKTLAQVAREWGLTPARSVERIIRENGNAGTINLEAYDPADTGFLATMGWMTTSTNGRTPSDPRGLVHPAVYGAFAEKLRRYAIATGDLSIAAAVESMSGSPADFLGLDGRGVLEPGGWADIAVLDLNALGARADFDDPHQYATGVEHLLVNGGFAIRDGAFVDGTLGMPIRAGEDFADPEG